MQRTLLMDPDDQPTLRLVPVLDSQEVHSTPPPSAPGGPSGQWLEPGAVLAGRYRILDRVGRGGMGVVYRAQDEQLGVCVALKVLRPEMADDSQLIERFRRELVLARQVTHRNAVRIYDLGQDLGQDGNLLFLTMDFVEGRSLQKLLRQEGPLEPARAAGIARQLALALEAAHEAGIVHRDLKPANVLIEESDRACITDFGVARSLGASGPTQAGSIVGTLAYLSPEQARGEEVDGRSDLYALGLLLFEMLTGELPFRAGSASEALAQRLTGASRDVRELRPDVPTHLAGIVRRLLERDPGRRFQSARELIDALDGARLAAPRARTFLAAALALPLLLAVVPRDRSPAPQEAAALPRHAVAVLPLLDETGRPDLASTATGLAERLAAALAESPGLRVIDSSRVLQTLQDLGLQDRPLGPEDLRHLADLFSADRLITGQVRSAGGRLRVDLNLVSSDLAGLPSSPLYVEGAGAVSGVAASLSGLLRERLGLERRAAAPPGSRSARQAQAREARRRGDLEQAREILSALVERYPYDVESRVELAETCAGLGDLRAAMAALRRVVGIDPNHPRAWQLLAAHAIQAGDGRRAADDYLVHALVVQNRLRREPGPAAVPVQLANRTQ